MSKIKNIISREILDSRGNPTVEVEVFLESGIIGTAAVPSGASTGTFEALELRDGDKHRYNGLGVLRAVNNVNTRIKEALIGKDALRQTEIDEAMLEVDGTENKSNLGANAILGVSLAVCRAAAMEKKIPLYEYIKDISHTKTKLKTPVPMFNVINGGMHSDSGLSIQEFKIVPIGIKKFSEQLRAGSEIFHRLKKNLEVASFNTGVGDEGGFAPKLQSNTQALELINAAIIDCGYDNKTEVRLGIDAAASNFFSERENCYILKPENANLERDRLVAVYREWIEKYNVISVEDGLGEEDWKGWSLMMEKINKKSFLSSAIGSSTHDVMFIGDDLLVTNTKRLKKAIEEKACNAVLIKVNQIGTLSETLECIALAKRHKMKVVVSHRSGETTDDFIADLAVGAGADFMKSGSLSRGERLCKYNRLLRIEEELTIK